ncbi:ABC transporter substrate-binding protein [Kiloniella laminariae]|uniref:ABC transporter substrate-binding protein n=1 Tax=Kiloniella laminariae TaxID=454162 RepID=A0ABT4LPG0_9PROT|nr:ABC transporter substrate-binding protein [Kiloniella laminariae]MCZ4282196.1 ABC transporter substrate-binding protein [Kiloniella laminariae]
MTYPIRHLFLSLMIFPALLVSAVAHSAPNRIITVGGPVTEIVYALGAGDRIIATDTTSKYPEQQENLPKVGYMRQLSAEGLLALQPDQIIALEGSGPAPVLDTLKDAGIAVTFIPELNSPEAIHTGVLAIAGILGTEENGQVLGHSVKEKLEVLQQQAQKRENPPLVLFLLSTGQGSPMTAGRGTAIDTIIQYSGARNAATDLQGFKPMASEYILAHAPDYLLLPSRTLEQAGGLEALKKDPLLGKLKAVQENRVLSLDGTLLLGLGPRTPEAIATISDQIFPNNR